MHCGEKRESWKRCQLLSIERAPPPRAPEDRARMKETRTQREPSILFCLPSAVFCNSRPSSPKLPPWSFSMPHFSLLRGPEDKATPGEFNLTPPLLGLPSNLQLLTQQGTQLHSCLMGTVSTKAYLLTNGTM